MRTLARMLKEVVSNHPHRHTVRKIIMLNDRKSYEDCLLKLKGYGIVPYKKVKRINMLCVHVNRSDDALQSFKTHASVHRIETDIKGRVHPIAKKKHPIFVNQMPWGVKRIRAPKVWKCAQGKRVKVAILDTGISPHPGLVIAGGANLIQPHKSFYDDNSHGTLVAGVIAATGKSGMPFGVAPRAKLYAVKVLNQNGAGYLSDIIEGLDWCIRNHMDVINMSLGIETTTIAALHAMVKQVYRNGIVMVASAGNSGPNNKISPLPARYREVITVAATDKRKRIASFSSRGKRVNVAAPGVGISSTNNKGGFEVVRGTSFSAPHVTGTVALMLGNKPKLSPRIIRKVLMKTAKFLKRFKRNAQGAGLIRANRTVSNCKKRS